MTGIINNESTINTRAWFAKMQSALVKMYSVIEQL
jgi:hypothetical protein